MGLTGLRILSTNLRTFDFNLETIRSHGKILNYGNGTTKSVFLNVLSALCIEL